MKTFKSDGSDYIKVLTDDYLVEKFLNEIEGQGN